MLELLLPLSLMAGAVAQDEAMDAPEELASYQEIDPSSLKRVYARDSDEATRVEVEHPMQDVCVRKLMAGSRVKARTVCQSQVSWKAYVEAQEAMAKEWADTGRALRSDEMITGAPSGRAYAPGGGPSRPPGG